MAEHFGDMVHHNGYIITTMQRLFEDTSAEAVWRALTLEAERVKWLAPGTIELKQGGKAKLDFKDSYVVVDSEVTECRAPNLLEFSWSGASDPDRPIHFELEDTAEGCQVTLTVSIPEDEVVARSCAGWEAHLTMLQAAVAGVPIKFPLERFQACREAFDAQLTALMMSEVPVLQL